MNRVYLSVLAGVLAVGGGLGLGASSAHAQVPSGAAPAAPRYYYGPGYYGYGYYSYPVAPSVPTYRGGFYYSAPARSYSSGSSTSRSAYDPTGRHDGLARPWLQPLR